MGIKIRMRDIPDSTGGGNYGPLPLGKYPAKMVVKAYQADAQGNRLTTADGESLYWLTQKGDPMWKLEFEILSADHAGRKVFDQLSFGEGGLKRVKVIYTRGGFGDGNEEEIELEPEELDGTFWWIDVDSHEVAQARGGAVKETRYEFKPNGCVCETCKANAGKKVNVNARIGFAGFAPMEPKDVVKFCDAAKMAKAAEMAPNDGKKCLPCNMGEHTHTLGKGCSCLNDDHPPF